MGDQAQRPGDRHAERRADASYELVDTAPGTYEIVLQMWRYVNYAKNPQGEFTASRFIDISNRVTITI